MTRWAFRSCPTCGGDLFQDPGEREWTCLACSRAFLRVARVFERPPTLPKVQERILPK